MFANINSTFSRLDRAAADLERTAAATRQTMGGGARGTLGEVATAATDLRRAVGDLRQLITRVDGSVAQMSSSTLPQMNAALGTIQEAAEALDRLRHRHQAGSPAHPDPAVGKRSGDTGMRMDRTPRTPLFEAFLFMLGGCGGLLGGGGSAEMYRFGTQPNCGSAVRRTGVRSAPFTILFVGANFEHMPATMTGF